MSKSFVVLSVEKILPQDSEISSEGLSILRVLRD